MFFAGRIQSALFIPPLFISEKPILHQPLLIGSIANDPGITHKPNVFGSQMLHFTEFHTSTVSAEEEEEIAFETCFLVFFHFQTVTLLISFIDFSLSQFPCIILLFSQKIS